MRDFNTLSSWMLLISVIFSLASSANANCNPPLSLGDTVKTLVDDPSGANALPAGTLGTVVCITAGSPPILVDWDGWSNGHNGNGFCTPIHPITNSASFVHCSEIELIPDNDNDGFHELIDCNDTDPNTYPGAPELCDGIDNNCDSVIPNDELDVDQDGVSLCQGDCDDTNPGIFPGATEILCDGIDNNCNGDADETLGPIGPDNYGYTADCIAPNFRNIGGTTWIPSVNNAISAPIEIPFEFDFYGQLVTQLFISTHGFIYLDNPGGHGCCGAAVPLADGINGLIAGFWEQYNTDEDSSSIFRYQVVGTFPNRELVVGFYNVQHNGPPPLPVTFQIILHERTSHIELQYLDAPSQGDGQRTSVGIENFDGTDGLQIAHGTDVAYNNQGFLIKHPCAFKLQGDANRDCIFNLTDFAILIENWLTDCKTDPNNPSCVPL